MRAYALIPALLLTSGLTASIVPAYTGLVAHYDFNQDSGSVLKDMSGHGHDGAISGAQWVKGIEGNALRFDGLQNRVSIPFAADLNTPEFTLQAWIRTDEKTHDQAIIDRVTPAGDRWNYRLMVPSRIHSIEGHPVPPGVVQSDVRDQFASRWDYIALGQSQVTLGRWKHIAATFKDRHFRIYVDGRLDGEKDVPIDAVASTSQPMLLGDCEFPQVNFKFRGDMDQVSIWNVALDADSIARMAAAYPTRAPEINVGMKAHYGLPGDTVWVPLYLTNFTGDSISSASFSLQYDPAIATLFAVKSDSGTAKGWSLLDWSTPTPDESKIAVGGAPRYLGYGEGELLRFGFRIKAEAAQGAVTALDVANVRFDEREDILVTNKPGRITVSGAKKRLGDVDEDGEISLADAVTVLAYVVGNAPADSAAPGFADGLADVSGNGEVTSYDAALIFQYAMGMIDHFPADSATAPVAPGIAVLGKRAASPGELNLSAPMHIEGDLYRYRLTGRGLQGLVAAELSFKLGSSAQSVESVSSGIPGARLPALPPPADGRFGIAVTTDDDVDEPETGVLDVVVRHRPGETAPGLELASAYLNEGRLGASGVSSQPLAARPHARAADVGRLGLMIAGAELGIQAAPGAPLEVNVIDPRGRTVLTRRWTAAPALARVPLAALPRGIMLVRITQPGSRRSALFANPRF